MSFYTYLCTSKNYGRIYTSTYKVANCSQGQPKGSF